MTILMRCYLIALCIVIPSMHAITFTTKSKQLAANKTTPGLTTYQLAITLNPGEFLYADSLTVSTNHPQAILGKWQVDTAPIQRYDQQFNSTKQLFDRSTTLTATITVHTDSPQASLVIGYLTNQLASPQFAFIALNDQPISPPTPTPVSATIQSVPSSEQVTPLSCSPQQQKTTTLSSWAQHIFSLTASWWIRLLLALLLGMLMSLTPCVYPMIPITIGILHAHKAANWRRHVALALSYMIGVASMFATLGLSAAFTGSLFGSLAGKPVVVLIVVAFLGYFALSLFGLYQLKLPSFLTKPHAQRPTGSIISAFLFGFISGTIASPCLSPGLAFLLSIVATLNSALYGFALLFMFGVGMSIPLIAIAISSNALTLMPRAGVWMVEIQKIFGILLIALCFYYLSNVLSLLILLVLMGTALLVLGFYYLLSGRQPSTYLTLMHRIIGISALSAAAFLYYKAIEHTHQNIATRCPIAWQTNYQAARAQAQSTHKLLFIDFGAPYCSICTAIDRCLLHDATIALLLNRMVCVRIDATQTSQFEPLSKQFKVIGVPTLLMIAPHTQQVMQRWGAELYTIKHQEFAKQLNELLAYSSKRSF